jgi:formyl-CoA transferase
MRLLNEVDVPCGPILSMKDLYNDPSLRKSGTLVEVEHPERGTFVTVANPIRLSDSQVPVARSPLLGEHTDEILKSLGYSAKEIEALRAEGTI